MIIDELQSGGKGGGTTSSARLAWRGGDFRLDVAMPTEFAAGRPDASPFLCASVLLAMRLGEDLDVRGPVSPPLLKRVARIVDLYAQWDPRLFRTRVRADAELEPAPRAGGIGCFFSRGVDSLYSAATPRGVPGRLTHLVFCDRLEPIHSAGVRAEEVRLAAEAAERLDLPLVLIESNVRELTDPIVRDWADMVGAGLSFLGTSMSGGLRHAVIPSSDGPKTLGPSGTSPMLDPLFSTAEVDVEHDAPATRPAKVAWLARERPDLLPYLKVCFREDRPDNCGRCSKCLLTMLALEAEGSLAQATGFPREVDAEALGAVRIRGLQPREEFEEVERALRARSTNDGLADLVGAALVRSAGLPPTELPDDSPAFLRRRSGQQPIAGRRRLEGPRTTVMMPSYEAEATLREAVGSVLGQTLGDLELVVVDDGSSTPVAEVLADVSDARLRILRHVRNRGLPAARNTALRAARAPLVSQLDADDLWEPGYLASVLPCFDDPGVGLAYSNCTILGHPAGHEDYIVDESVHPMHDFPKIAEQNPVPSPTATMRTLAVRGVGGYARWLRQCEDYHLYMKLAAAGWRFAYIHRRLARYRWPSPGRGMSHDRRRHQLWEHAMFGSFVLRHPLTPGPRRQVRVRARREVDQALAIARRGLPRLAGERPRLLVEPGSYAMLNLGDVAMLQVCVDRLRALWPTASIGVITEAPDRLARYCPGVEPVALSGQQEWFGHPWAGGAYWPSLPAARRAPLERLARRVSDRSPRAARLAVRAQLLAREPSSDQLREFVGWLLRADAVIVSGRGGTTDVFLEDATQVLELVHTATALALPTAMFGQGLGPLDDETLRTLARDVLPRVDVLTVREQRAALPLLEGLGVPTERVAVTGDEALELVHRLRSETDDRPAIGVGLRLSGYSGMGESTAREIGRRVRDAAERHGADLRPITISLYPHEADERSLRHVLDGQAGNATTPEEAIAEAGRCRVVVAGSYHAALFALGQGVPVVGLSATPYYEAKLEGLAELFPGGCTVVSVADPDFGHRLTAALDEVWEAADRQVPALMAAAERQIAAARRAYGRFAETVEGHVRVETAGQRLPIASVSHSSVSSESASRYL